MEKHINSTKIMKRKNLTNLWKEWAAAKNLLKVCTHQLQSVPGGQNGKFTNYH